MNGVFIVFIVGGIYFSFLLGELFFLLRIVGLVSFKFAGGLLNYFV